MVQSHYLRLALRFIIDSWLLVCFTPLAVKGDCASQHPDRGVFICYPVSPANAAESLLTDYFHISAQGNAPGDQAITAFKILVDNQVLIENKLDSPSQRVTIETNVKSPFVSGSHTLQVEFSGAGSARVEGLRFYPSPQPGFCDPFSRFNERFCSRSRIGGPVRWSISGNKERQAYALGRYRDYLDLFGQNLKSLETDVFDAMTVDGHGNAYIASHWFADIELRKYAPDGAILYSSFTRACGPGFSAVAGITADDAGRVWIAANTSACLPTSPHALHSLGKLARGTRGFVLLLDTTNPQSRIGYATYLSDVENQIVGLRVDKEGNAYVAGNASSLAFSHDAAIPVGKRSRREAVDQLGFVAVLNSAGTKLQWSTLLQNAQLTALARNGAGGVFVAGRTSSRRLFPRKKERNNVIVAELSSGGQGLSYLARTGTFKDSGAISIARDGSIVVAGGMFDYDAGLYVATLPACKAGAAYLYRFPASDAKPPNIALVPALDALTNGLSGESSPDERIKRVGSIVRIAPKCGR